MAQWRNGTMAQWCKGARVFCYKKNLFFPLSLCAVEPWCRSLEFRTWYSPYSFSLFSKGKVIEFINQGNLMSTTR